MTAHKTSTFLPPQNSPARRFTFFLFVFVPLLVGMLGLFLGQDSNWDLRNYHWYNGYALVTGRLGFDLLPSQVPYFYNPALDVPFYLLASQLPARLVGFLLSFVQGLNFILLFMLAHASLRIADAMQKTVLCALLAVLGILGGGGIAQIGTTFYDNITSLGIFLAALLVLRFSPLLRIATPKTTLFLTVLCGFPAGLMMGLKLPAVIFAVGLCGAMLFTGGNAMRRVWLGFGFGIGVLLGLALSLGPWADYLYDHFGSPLFPYFNNFFQSPLAPATSARDTQFLPGGWWEYLFFPYVFTQNPYAVGEIPWRDLRLPLLYFLLPFCLVMKMGFGRNTAAAADRLTTALATRYLLALATITYFTWLFLFSIYRYLIALEMLAPLLLVMAIGMLPIRMRLRTVLAGTILAAVMVSIQPGNWGRKADWSEKMVTIVRPDLADSKNCMILMAGFEPYSHVVSEFPPDIPFVRIQSNFASPDENKGINALIRTRVNGHGGQFKLLMPGYQLPMGEEALQYFDLRVQLATCQPVRDDLYDSQLQLCDVVRTNSFTLKP